jgi:hypothetical protein
MLKQNRWTLGEAHFVVPPLPLKLRGRYGCSLHRALFDWRVGEEVYLTFREEPGYAEQYADVKPLTVIAKTGMMRTPHGAIGYVVWQIAVGTANQVAVDQYVNPHHPASVQLLADAGNQTHLKFVILNTVTGEVTVFVEFENSFALGELATGMAQAARDQPLGDFSAARLYAMDEIGAEQLLSMGQGR